MLEVPVYKKGDDVFIIDAKTNNVHPARVIDIKYDRFESEITYEVRDTTNGGKNVLREKHIYSRYLDAKEAKKAMDDARVEAYKKEMPDGQSLLAFPLSHNLSGEEFDEFALTAYKERAKELGMV